MTPKLQSIKEMFDRSPWNKASLGENTVKLYFQAFKLNAYVVWKRLDQDIYLKTHKNYNLDIK